MGLSGLLQLLPLLLLFLFTFVNFDGSSGSSSIYSLKRDTQHPIKRTTDGRGVDYFVKSGFEREIQVRARHGSKRGNEEAF